LSRFLKYGVINRGIASSFLLCFKWTKIRKRDVSFALSYEEINLFY